RGLDIGDVALELRLSGIGDGSDANRIHPGRDLFARVKLGIELGETLSIGAALKWIGAGLDRTAFEAAQAFKRVLRPADRFPEFAVADHVDAGLGLAANDGADRLGQARLIGFWRRTLRRPASCAGTPAAAGAGSGCRHGW